MSFNREQSRYISIAVSGALHIAVFLLVFVLTMQRAEEYTTAGGYLSLDALASGGDAAASVKEQPEVPDENSAQPENTGNTTGTNTSAGGSLLGKADTSSLKGVYSEPSLGVSIRYPQGWTYLDQSLKKKLDGITFIGAATTNGEVPYVHIKVQEKYLFNPSRYKFNSSEEKFTLYYNDPQILEGQYQLEVYVKTEIEEDFQIKLIIHTEAAYNEFKPVFLAMVKTFAYKGIR